VAPPPKKQSLRQRLGDPPLDDSLAAISWMQRALAATAADVLEGNLSADEKREALLKIADRMAKLRDPDRLYQAEEALRAARNAQQDNSPGPQLTDARNLDGAAGPITARRGRPPRRSLS
jgi:hypothetical protein